MIAFMRVTAANAAAAANKYGPCGKQIKNGIQI
jgi:hypothetical protein